MQSGFREYALLDQRVLRKLESEHSKGLRADGRNPRSYNGENILDEADFKNMDHYVKKYLKCEIKSQTQAYLDMIDDKYSNPNVLSAWILRLTFMSFVGRHIFLTVIFILSKSWHIWTFRPYFEQVHFDRNGHL